MKTLLQAIGPDIWIYDAEAVSFYGMPYTTRMTIVRLGSNSLWIHSPSKITEQLLAELAKIGSVEYLIAPNALHHLYLLDWHTQFPKATLYAAPDLRKKRPDVPFDMDLQDHPEPQWQADIDQLVFYGSRALTEVVFFHKPSRTLIVTDLIENFPQDHFKGFRKLIAHLTGIVAPNGKMPLDFRLSFRFGGMKKARICLKKMLKWAPENIILSHGIWIKGEGKAFLQKSFQWLL